VTDKVKTFLALSDRARVSRLHSQNSIEIDLGAMTDAGRHRYMSPTDIERCLDNVP
jgi:hypothetical protein